MLAHVRKRRDALPEEDGMQRGIIEWSGEGRDGGPRSRQGGSSSQARKARILAPGAEPQQGVRRIDRELA